MILAVEDQVGEAVARKLLAAVRPQLTVDVVLGRSGKGYLQTKARQLNRSARGLPVLILTDQDSSAECPGMLLDAWFGTRSPDAFFQVAVMEVEGWILADRRRASTMLGVSIERLPAKLDDVEEPKELLVGLARRSRHSLIRRELVPEAGSTAIVGPVYNARVSEFVERMWSPIDAARASGSLTRAIDRLNSRVFPNS